MSIRRIVLPSVAPPRFLENKKGIYFIHLTKVDLLNHETEDPEAFVARGRNYDPKQFRVDDHSTVSPRSSHFRCGPRDADFSESDSVSDIATAGPHRLQATLRPAAYFPRGFGHGHKQFFLQLRQRRPDICHRSLH